MRKLSAGFIVFFLSFSGMAQDGLQVGSFVDVLTHPALQTSKEIAEATSQLETQEAQSRQGIDCQESQVEASQSCEAYQSQLVPQHLKEAGWQVLFEAKYAPLSTRTDHAIQNRSTGSQTFDFNTRRVENYFELNPIDDLTITDPQALRLEASRISALYPSSSPDEFYGPLVLHQLQKSQNHDEMMSTFRNLTQGMSDQAFTNLMTHFAGWAEYNYDRAALKQEEGAALGLVTPLGIINQTQSGICGDIHSMVAKFAEQRGWEAFTVGYANDGNQHIVTAMVNPNQPDKLMVVNYGSYEEHTLTDANSILPAPTGPGSPGFAEIGMQLRIFKNTGGDGAMQQLAVLPTPLGSLMRSLFNREDQHSRVIPENENFQIIKAEARHNKASTELTEQGLKERKVAHGIVVYEGETDNAQVYGVAVSRDVFNHLYKYDPDLRRCVKKRSRYFSLGVAGSLVDLPAAELSDTFYVYLNIRGGQIFSIYQTEFFQFKGLLGYEIDGFLATKSSGEFLTADGNLTTFAGLMAEYQKNGNTLYGGLRLETNVAFKDQTLWTDLSALPRNVNPINFNALAVDLGGSTQLSENLVLKTSNTYLLSRVGSRVMLSTSLINNNTTYSLSYQGQAGSLPIGNSLRRVNLLQDTSGLDGYRFSVGQQFRTRNLNGSVNGYVGMTSGNQDEKFFFGGSLKINFRSPRR